MTESDLILYWARLLQESSDDFTSSELLDERRTHRQRKLNKVKGQRQPKSRQHKKQRQTLTYDQMMHSIRSSFARLKQTEHLHPYLFVFNDLENGKSDDTRINGKQVKLWLQKGSRKSGALHICKRHLIDGGNAVTGGFTLQELNRDIRQILRSKPELDDHIDENGKRNNNWRFTLVHQGRDDSRIETFEWYVTAYKLNDIWMINTIQTNREPSDTQTMKEQFFAGQNPAQNKKQKSSGSFQGLSTSKGSQHPTDQQNE